METKFIANYAVHPGTLLEEELQALELSQAELSRQTGISKTIINEVIKGKRPINPKMAVMLEKVLESPARFWLNAQSLYDEAIARMQLAEDQIKDEQRKDVLCNNAEFDVRILAADVIFPNYTKIELEAA